MEARVRGIFLSILVLLFLFAVTPVRAQTEKTDEEELPDLEKLQEIESVIQPEIERTKFDESKIESQDIEFVPTMSIFSIEDFGTNIMLAVKVQYHATEDIFVGAEYGQSEAGETSYETLTSGSAPLLSSSQRTYKYYMFTMAYNLLPGEAFITDDTTYNMGLYVTAGLGSADFGGNTNVVLAFGVGYRLLVSNFSTLYIEMRDHSFNSDITGEDKLTHNLEFGIGYGFYF